MHLMSTIRSSAVLKKILRQILLVCLITLAVILCICGFILWPRLKEDSTETAQSSQREIASQISDYVTAIDSIASYICTSSTLSDALAAYYEDPGYTQLSAVNLTLHELCSNMDNLRSVIVVDEDDEYFTSLINIKEADMEYYEAQSIENIKKYSPIYALGTDPENYGLCHTTQAKINGTQYTFYFFYKMDSALDSCASLASGIFDGYAIASASMDILYLSDEDLSIPVDELSAGEVYTTAGGFYFVQSVSDLNWYLISYSSRSTFSANMRSIFSMVILFFVIFVLLIFLLLTPAVAHVVAPIYELNLIIQQVTKENIDIHSDIKTNDEIGQLSDVYNNMIDTIHEHIDWRLENESNMYRMQYNLLVEQINSHFILNSMTTINVFARRGRTDDVVKMNTALLQILQNCLRVKTFQTTDTVEQELHVLEQYLIIEKMRFDNKAEVIFDVPDELMNEEMPKNILQTIVENSFRHGLYDKTTGEISGTVLLSIRKEGSVLTIHIHDNGTGASAEIIEKLNNPEEYAETKERGRHIGLGNIYERLKFIYKEGASIEFYSDDGFDTVITIDMAEKRQEIASQEGRSI